MLRFPILRPSGVRMYIRNERLKKERREQIAENELRILQMQQDNVYKPVTLMGHIGNKLHTIAYFINNCSICMNF